MESKRQLLRNSRLYLIIDKRLCRGRSLGALAKKIKISPADIVQLRDKRAKKAVFLKETLLLRRIFSQSGKLFLVNDYPDIAKISGADGVHLGQTDLSVKAARMILGRQSIIGKSCHTLRQAAEAQKEGADYIGMGPVFPTRTKAVRRKKIELELLPKASRRLKIPVFAIGGITADGLGKILQLGIRRVAVCGAILGARNIALTAENLAKMLTRHSEK